MLIRDDGAEPPDYQFSNWVDGVIFVFSLEKEDSLNVLYKLHDQLFKLRNNSIGGELPCILVGTQGSLRTVSGGLGGFRRICGGSGRV